MKITTYETGGAPFIGSASETALPAGLEFIQSVNPSGASVVEFDLDTTTKYRGFRFVVNMCRPTTAQLLFFQPKHGGVYYTNNNSSGIRTDKYGTTNAVSSQSLGSANGFGLHTGNVGTTTTLSVSADIHLRCSREAATEYWMQADITYRNSSGSDKHEFLSYRNFTAVSNTVDGVRFHFPSYSFATADGQSITLYGIT